MEMTEGKPATDRHEISHEINVWPAGLEHQLPESPGTRKLRELALNEKHSHDDEIAPRFIERPQSSRSTDLQACVFGTAPRNRLQINKARSNQLFVNSGSALTARPKVIQDDNNDVFIANSTKQRCVKWTQ